MMNNFSLHIHFEYITRNVKSQHTIKRLGDERAIAIQGTDKEIWFLSMDSYSVSSLLHLDHNQILIPS